MEKLKIQIALLPKVKKALQKLADADNRKLKPFLEKILTDYAQQPNDQSTHEELQRVIQATEYMGKVFEQVQKSIEHGK